MAPEKKRAAAISVVLSGLLFGILPVLALAGTIAEFTASWRVVYYFAVGVQVLVLVGNYLMLPDYLTGIAGHRSSIQLRVPALVISGLR